MAAEKISSVASIASNNLQGQRMLVSKQIEALENLIATLTNDFGFQHVSGSGREALGSDKNSIVSDNGRFGVSVESLRGFLDNLRTFYVDCVEALKAEELRSLLLDLGCSVLNLICGIGYISDERDSRNESGATLPVVLPHDIVKLQG